jgi:hypothetical protein
VAARGRTIPNSGARAPLTSIRSLARCTADRGEPRVRPPYRISCSLYIPCRLTRCRALQALRSNKDGPVFSRCPSTSRASFLRRPFCSRPTSDAALGQKKREGLTGTSLSRSCVSQLTTERHGPPLLRRRRHRRSFPRNHPGPSRLNRTGRTPTRSTTTAVDNVSLVLRRPGQRLRRSHAPPPRSRSARLGRLLPATLVVGPRRKKP